MRRYAQRWRQEHAAESAAAFVPQIYAPGEAYQFDWSHEIVILDGVTTEVKVAQMRLCHSRMPFIRAYPREAQEMLFDAHDKAFAFYRGACERGNLRQHETAVDAIFVGKERLFNRRFLQMMSHYLVEPTPCTPGAAWEKGQIDVHRRRSPTPLHRAQHHHSRAARQLPGSPENPTNTGFNS